MQQYDRIVKKIERHKSIHEQQLKMMKKLTEIGTNMPEEDTLKLRERQQDDLLIIRAEMWSLKQKLGQRPKTKEDFYP